MNLYHWARSEALKEYSCGDIIVMAASLAEARQKALAYADIWLKEHRSWWFNADGSIDTEGYGDYYIMFRHRLVHDLEIEPDLIEAGTVFIRGSE